MTKIAKKIGELVPELVRVDLFTNGVDVYFSEMTMTPDACKDASIPSTTQKLFHWALFHKKLVHQITPDIVKCIINEPEASMDQIA